MIRTKSFESSGDIKTALLQLGLEVQTVCRMASLARVLAVAVAMALGAVPGDFARVHAVPGVAVVAVA